jgi:hypothetical protein
LKVLNHEHNTKEWRLFIDSFKVSLKAVLHNGNKFPSEPVVHATNTEESYENMKILLEKIQYEKYSWKICLDLKIIFSFGWIAVWITEILLFVAGSGRAGSGKAIM